jgi:hypothetical protein
MLHNSKKRTWIDTIYVFSYNYNQDRFFATTLKSCGRTTSAVPEMSVLGLSAPSGNSIL